MAVAEFRALLQQRLAAPDANARARIDEEIRSRWERPRAVLISDMSGFSRITRQEGILHFLGMIVRMQAICGPIIEDHDGKLVKVVADNLFACFATAQAATLAAIEMQRACLAASTDLREDHRVELGIGIAAGPILDLDGEDFYGDPVNVAAKLGEDIADGGDLLVSRDTAAQVQLPAQWTATPHACRISNVDIEYVALVGPNAPMQRQPKQ